MRHAIIMVFIIVLIGCKGGAGKTEASDTAVTTSNIINGSNANIDSAYMNGAKLIATNDCLTCHDINNTGFGPSYKQVAAKYGFNQGNVENLADRVIKGARGLWGQNQMTPHRDLSQQDAQEMVKYILSLKDITGL